MTPLASATARSAAMTDLLKHVLYDSLEKTIYTASLASLDTNLTSSDLGLEIKLRGFSNKLPQLTHTVLKTLSELSSTVTEASFVMQTEKLRRMYLNDGLKAGSVVNSARLLALKPNTHSSKAKLEECLTLRDFKSFVKAFCHDGVCAEVTFHGNVSEEGALCLVQQSLQESSFTLRAEAYPTERIVKLPDAPAVTVLKQSPGNPNEPSVAVDVYYQLGQYSFNDDHNMVYLDLLEQALYEPFFDQLRTKQQLGYSVNCGTRNTFGVLGFVFSVVSSSHTVAQVQEAILKFAQSVPKLIAKMNRDDWLDYVESMTAENFSLPQISLMLPLTTQVVSLIVATISSILTCAKKKYEPSRR